MQSELLTFSDCKAKGYIQLAGNYDTDTTMGYKRLHKALQRRLDIGSPVIVAACDFNVKNVSLFLTEQPSNAKKCHNIVAACNKVKNSIIDADLIKKLLPNVPREAINNKLFCLSRYGFLIRLSAYDRNTHTLAKYVIAEPKPLKMTAKVFEILKKNKLNVTEIAFMAGISVNKARLVIFRLYNQFKIKREIKDRIKYYYHEIQES